MKFISNALILQFLHPSCWHTALCGKFSVWRNTHTQTHTLRENIKLKNPKYAIISTGDSMNSICESVIWSFYMYEMKSILNRKRVKGRVAKSNLKRLHVHAQVCLHTCVYLNSLIAVGGLYAVNSVISKQKTFCKDTNNSYWAPQGCYLYPILEPPHWNSKWSGTPRSTF